MISKSDAWLTSVHGFQFTPYDLLFALEKNRGPGDPCAEWTYKYWEERKRIVPLSFHNGRIDLVRVNFPSRDGLNTIADRHGIPLADIERLLLRIEGRNGLKTAGSKLTEDLSRNGYLTSVNGSLYTTHRTSNYLRGNGPKNKN